MDQRISLVTLGVSDLDRAIRFYEALGWRRSMRDAEGVAFFQTGAVALSLYPRPSLAHDLGVDADTLSGTQAVTIAINVPSREAVDAAIREAEAAGGRIVRPAGDVFWGGYIGYFADPDGFLWEIAWNPGFTLEADGRLVLPD